MARLKRNILAAAEETTTPPETLAANQAIARIIKAEGNNLYSCALPNGKEVLAELAARFRSTIWVRRGGYVLWESADEEERKGSRVEGEIVNIIRDERGWRKQAYWPKEFTKRVQDSDDEESNVGKMPPSDSEDDFA